MRTRLRKALVYGAAFLAALSGWAALVVRETDQQVPRGRTLAEHLSVMPQPQSYGAFSLAGQEYLAAWGPMRAWWTLPSGGPVYIFDSRGQLVDWSPDTGDDEAFLRRWPVFYPPAYRALTANEATAWAERGSQEPE
jgi:hypothetical protein